MWRAIFILLLLPTQLLAREVPITILHTCDLHGNVLPTEDYKGNTNLGGIARCATMIRELRAKQPEALLVDAGDTIQGAAVSFLSDGQVMVKALNHLHYDAWVWGNHEFDWGLEKLAACAERSEIPILNANVGAAFQPRPEPQDRDKNVAPTNNRPAADRIIARLKPYLFREIDGVKIAIIGLNTPGIPNWSRPRLIDGLQFADSIETLKKIVPEVRAAGAEVIVLVCHQGFKDSGDDHANQVIAIAQNFPEIDVIIGGHTHRDFPEFKVRNILYCQANYYGIHLGRVDLVYDTDKRRVTQARSNTLSMDSSVAVNAELTKLAGEELDRAAKVLNTVVGEATGEFGTRAAPRKETPIHNLIFQSIAEALEQRSVKVDAIVHGIFEKRATIPKGAITIGQIWRVVPYENTIGVAQLTPGELVEILEENATDYDGYAFRGIWGLKWTFDPEAPKGKRTISLLTRDGKPLEPGTRLAVAFNSYELASGGLRWNKLRELVDQPASKLVEYDFQTRQAVIDYVRRHGQISPVEEGWWTAKRVEAARTGADAGTH